MAQEELEQSLESAPNSVAGDADMKAEKKPWHMPKARIVDVPGVTASGLHHGRPDSCGCS
jgi:hypothetical protein